MFEHPTRRDLLAGAAAFSAWAAIPKLAVAAGSGDPRLVVVILRGGLDGLAAVAPIADPAYEEVRERFALEAGGDHSGLPLDGSFALNPKLANLGSMYRDGEALFVHAAHTPYRERSHFEAQDVLENGTTSSAHYADGWLGRALAMLPVDDVVARRGAFAAASSTPLVLRGAKNVVTYLPAGFAAASADTRARLLSLYEHTDPVLAEAMAAGLQLDRVTGGEVAMAAAVDEGMMGMQVRGPQREVVAAATAAGRAMSRDDGPRVGFLDMSGFDTHRQQKLVDGRLGLTLAALDGALLALRNALDTAWRDTVVMVVTEFGRTVRMNGSFGTDHGSATVAMLLGGAIAGGRVIADWPGLGSRDLFEGRDLMPTTDLRGVLKGVLADHMGFAEAELATTIFPDSAAVRPLTGLVSTLSDRRASLR